MEVEERSRVQLELAGLGPEPIAAVAACSEGSCFALHGFLVSAFLHVVQIDCFRAAGNGGLRLEPFEPHSAC